MRIRLSSPRLELDFDDSSFSTLLSNSKTLNDSTNSSAGCQSFMKQRYGASSSAFGLLATHIDWRDGWKTTCSQLPASLQQVSFEFHFDRPGTHAKRCRPHGNTRWLKEIKAAANPVKVSSEKIMRSAPGAAVEMHESARKDLLPEHPKLFDAAVNDVERWLGKDGADNVGQNWISREWQFEGDVSRWLAQ